MNCRCMCPIVTVLMLLSRATAQSSDWKVVKNLRPGTQIALQFGQHRFPTKCHLESVSEDDLTCGLGWPVSMQVRTYSRASIGIVRIARNTARIGLIAGAAAGTIVGLTRNPVPGMGRGGTALIQGSLFAVVAVGIGGIVGPMFPGRVIYRAAPQPKPPDQARKTPIHLPKKNASHFRSTSIPWTLTEELEGSTRSLLLFPTESQFSCESL